MTAYRRIFRPTVVQQLDQLDKIVIHWMARYGTVLLRSSLGIVFLWFGILKLFPGTSPVADLVTQATAFLPLPSAIIMPVLAIWEIIIGLGFISGRFTRLTVILMLAQMAGTLTPIISTPELVFVKFPFVLTMTGEFIAKNMILVSAGLVIGATSRGGSMSDLPLRSEQSDVPAAV